MYPYPGQPPQGQPGYPPQYPPSPYPPAGGYPYPGATPGYPPANQAPYPPTGGQAPYPSAGQAPYPGSPYAPQPDLGFPSSPYPQQPSAGYPHPTSGYPPAGYPTQSHQTYPAQQQAYPSAYPNLQQSAPYGQQYPPQSQEFSATRSVTHTAHSSPSMTTQAYQEVPTIREGHCVPNDDANILRKAMKGFGTDEASIINVVTKRTNAQQVQIVNAYKASFGKDLIKDIKGETSGQFENVLVALLTPKYDFAASTIKDAVAGIGTKEMVLVDVLCTATNQEIHWIRAAYQRLYNRNMENDIRSDLSGYFGRLMVSVCAAGRDENPVANPAMATKDAQDLMAAGLKKMGTDESEFIRILMTRSYAHLRTVFHEYQKLSGQDIEQSIKSEFSGDIEKGLLAVVKCVKNRAAYFAERLRNAMAGAGTKDGALIYIIVTRAEIDLESIKSEYNRMYHKQLGADVSSETSGDYKKTLLALIA